MGNGPSRRRSQFGRSSKDGDKRTPLLQSHQDHDPSQGRERLGSGSFDAPTSASDTSPLPTNSASSADAAAAAAADGPSTDYVWLFDALNGLLGSQHWRTDIEAAIDEHCQEFGKGHRPYQTSIFDRIRERAEQIIFEFVSELGVEDQQFYDACYNPPNSNARAIVHLFAAFQNFDMFQELMKQRSQGIEQRAASGLQSSLSRFTEEEQLNWAMRASSEEARQPVISSSASPKRVVVGSPERVIPSAENGGVNNDEGNADMLPDLNSLVIPQAFQDDLAKLEGQHQDREEMDILGTVMTDSEKLRATKEGEMGDDGTLPEIVDRTSFAEPGLEPELDQMDLPDWDVSAADLQSMK